MRRIFAKLPAICIICSAEYFIAHALYLPYIYTFSRQYDVRLDICESDKREQFGRIHWSLPLSFRLWSDSYYCSARKEERFLRNC